MQDSVLKNLSDFSLFKLFNLCSVTVTPAEGKLVILKVFLCDKTFAGIIINSLTSVVCSFLLFSCRHGEQ